MLWIKGKPGAGKSTVLKYALETAERNTTQAITLASFFFHGRGASLQKNVLGFFRSLIHQILQKDRDLLSRLTSLYKDRCETEGDFGAKWDWHQKQLQSFFKRNVVEAARKYPIRIYIDALDECGEDLAIELVEFLRCFAAPIPICFSCRHYPFVALEGGSEVCVEHENEQDIESYVNDKINTHVQRVDIAQVIRNEMVSRSKGNFQWVVLVLPRVLKLHRSRKSLVAIRTMIRNIPAELNELYTALLDFADDYERVQSLRLLQWISFAYRPLTLRDLRFALVVSADTPHTSVRECQSSDFFVDNDEDMERIVCDRSRGLVEVIENGSERVAQFAHQSVKDFLLEQGGFQILDHASEGTVVGRGHFWLSRSCVKCFLMKEVQNFATSPQDVFDERGQRRMKDGFPLLNYSSKYFIPHVREVDVANMAQDDLVAMDFEATDGIPLHSWFAVYSRLYLRFPPYSETLLHAASTHNLIGIVKVILARIPWADHKEKGSRTVPFIAAAKGYEVVVEKTMSREEVDLNSKCGGHTPLSIAAKKGHTSIVEMLTDGDGVDVNSKDEWGDTPLSLATKGCHEAIVMLLLNRDDVDVNSKNKFSETPLSLATQGCHEAIVMLLLNRSDVDVNMKNEYSETPLVSAYDGIDDAVIEMPMTPDDVEPGSMDWRGNTPLSLAAERGYEAIVKMLLNRNGVDTNSRDPYGRTPFSRAARFGDISIMQALLERGVDLSPNNGQLTIALFEAARRGHCGVVELLLQHNANTNARDNKNRTPLSYAAIKGCCVTVNLLLLQTVLQDVDIDVRDIDGRTPLSYAVSRGHVDVVKLLLQYNANIDFKDNEGRTPLSRAAFSGYLAMVKLLIQHNADIDSKDMKGRTPLFYAAFDNDVLVVKLLYEETSNADQKDEDGRTPLSYAVRFGNLEVVKFLVERGDIDINSKDTYGRSALSWALKTVYSHVFDVVGYLLEQDNVIVTEDDRDVMKQTPNSGEYLKNSEYAHPRKSGFLLMSRYSEDHL